MTPLPHPNQQVHPPARHQWQAPWSLERAINSTHKSLESISSRDADYCTNQTNLGTGSRRCFFLQQQICSFATKEPFLLHQQAELMDRVGSEFHWAKDSRNGGRFTSLSLVAHEVIIAIPCHTDTRKEHERTEFPHLVWTENFGKYQRRIPQSFGGKLTLSAFFKSWATSIPVGWHFSAKKWDACVHRGNVTCHPVCNTVIGKVLTGTPPKFNIAPEKLPSQWDSNLPNTIFSRAMLNFGGVYTETGLAWMTRSFLFHIFNPEVRQWAPHVKSKKRRCYVGVSKNNRTSKSSILIGFSIINHPFWGTPIFGNTYFIHDSSYSKYHI